MIYTQILSVQIDESLHVTIAQIKIQNISCTPEGSLMLFPSPLPSTR